MTDQLIDEEYVVLVEIYGQGETEVREVKPVPVLLTKTPHGPPWD